MAGLPGPSPVTVWGAQSKRVDRKDVLAAITAALDRTDSPRMRNAACWRLR